MNTMASYQKEAPNGQKLEYSQWLGNCHREPKHISESGWQCQHRGLCPDRAPQPRRGDRCRRPEGNAKSSPGCVGGLAGIGRSGAHPVECAPARVAFSSEWTPVRVMKTRQT